MRPALEADEEGGRLLHNVREIEERARTRGAALESTSAELTGRLAEFDAEIAAVEKVVAVESAKVGGLAAEVARVDDLLSRAEAKQKRVDIEIRSAQQAARAAAGPEARVAPPEFAEKITALGVERDARVAEVARARADVDEARKPLTQQERVVAEHERKITDLRKKRRAVEDSYGRQLSVRNEGVAEVEKERRVAMVDVARRLLAGSRLPIDPGARASVEEADKAKRKALVEVEMHVRGLDAYDRAGLKNGLIVIAGGVALILALLAALASMTTSAPA
jgi:chromosome segregation ATPase